MRQHLTAIAAAIAIGSSAALAQTESVPQQGGNEAGQKLAYLPSLIKDPVLLFGLAHRIQADSVLKDVRSCFSLPNCETWQSALRTVPSTRLIAAIQDCNQLATVKNEFDLRDLDAKIDNAVRSAAATAPTAYIGRIFAQPGSYDFQREGFPLSWQNAERLFKGPKTCNGQPIVEYRNAYPTDFHVVFDLKSLPDFIRVEPQKARSWLEKGGLALRAHVHVQLTKVYPGGFKMNEYSWIFAGHTSIKGLFWQSNAGELEEVAMAPPAAPAPPLPAAAAIPAAEILKTGRSRIIKSDVNVRATPSKSADLAVVLKPNQYVVIQAKSPDGLWSMVSLNKKEVGWILDSAFLKNSMTEEEAAAISEGDMYDNVEPPKN